MFTCAPCASVRTIPCALAYGMCSPRSSVINTLGVPGLDVTAPSSRTLCQCVRPQPERKIPTNSPQHYSVHNPSCRLTGSPHNAATVLNSDNRLLPRPSRRHPKFLQFRDAVRDIINPHNTTITVNPFESILSERWEAWKMLDRVSARGDSPRAWRSRMLLCRRVPRQSCRLPRRRRIPRHRRTPPRNCQIGRRGIIITGYDGSVTVWPGQSLTVRHQGYFKRIESLPIGARPEPWVAPTPEYPWSTPNVNAAPSSAPSPPPPTGRQQSATPPSSIGSTGSDSPPDSTPATSPDAPSIDTSLRSENRTSQPSLSPDMLSETISQPNASLMPMESGAGLHYGRAWPVATSTTPATDASLGLASPNPAMRRNYDVLMDRYDSDRYAFRDLAPSPPKHPMPPTISRHPRSYRPYHVPTPRLQPVFEGYQQIAQERGHDRSRSLRGASTSAHAAVLDTNLMNWQSTDLPVQVGSVFTGCAATGTPSLHNQTTLIHNRAAPPAPLDLAYNAAWSCSNNAHDLTALLAGTTVPPQSIHPSPPGTVDGLRGRGAATFGSHASVSRPARIHSPQPASGGHSAAGFQQLDTHIDRIRPQPQNLENASRAPAPQTLASHPTARESEVSPGTAAGSGEASRRPPSAHGVPSTTGNTTPSRPLQEQNPQALGFAAAPLTIDPMLLQRAARELGGADPAEHEQGLNPGADQAVTVDQMFAILEKVAWSS
ncbi:hypothetical protein C8Q77DRAFT_219753 [Trametes polyzona]|nr:hypothetical protein C8Q77DRAFT_219753 [Trametes polyzona]